VVVEEEVVDEHRKDMAVEEVIPEKTRGKTTRKSIYSNHKGLIRYRNLPSKLSRIRLYRQSRRPTRTGLIALKQLILVSDLIKKLTNLIV